LHQKFDLLLGSRTYEIWEPYWPHHGEFWPEANSATKYVASRTRTTGAWEKTVFLNGDLANAVRELKSQAGPELHIWGSSQLVQQLMRLDVIDEFWLVIYPVILGSGKRLFADTLDPRAFRLTNSNTTPRGVVVARYGRSDLATTES
jgi:dihydrofolate reductase